MRIGCFSKKKTAKIPHKILSTYNWSLGKTSIEKKRFLLGIARMRGGGVYPCPDLLAPFFCQVTVLKMAIFYSNFTVRAGVGVLS